MNDESTKLDAVCAKLDRVVDILNEDGGTNADDLIVLFATYLGRATAHFENINGEKLKKDVLKAFKEEFDIQYNFYISEFGNNNNEK